MKTVMTLIKKEFARFFKDKRLVLSLVLPGVLIFVIYSLMGSVLGDRLMGGSDDKNYKICTYNAPAELETLVGILDETVTIVLEEVDEGGMSALKEQIEAQEGDVDLLIEFPEGFTFSTEENCVITFTYNSARAKGSAAAKFMEALVFGVTSPVAIQRTDLVTEKDMTAQIFSSIIPMLLMSMLFAGCISIAPEAIAGEKERGTLGAMLVTPVKRSHIALGKIISLSSIALLSGVCSFTGLVFSVPKLLASSGVSFSASSYSFGDYVMLLGVVLSSVLVMVAAVSVVSAFAKSVKEATGFVGPLSIVPLLLGLSTMFTSGSGHVALYCLPLYNSARALHGIFSFTVNPLRVLITIISNVVWAVVISIALAKMFDSEKVMFNS